MTSKFFRLTKRTFWRFRDELCERCTKPFQIDDDVVSRHRPNNTPCFYHQKCYNAMYVEV
jgi:hypothetical protein